MEKAIEKLPLFSTFYNRKGFLRQGSISPRLCMRPSLYYVSKKTGWVGLKKAVFTDVQYCIYADTVSG